MVGTEVRLRSTTAPPATASVRLHVDSYTGTGPHFGLAQGVAVRVLHPDGSQYSHAVKVWESVVLSGVFHALRKAEVDPNGIKVSILAIDGVLPDELRDSDGLAIAASRAVLSELGRYSDFATDDLNGWYVVEIVHDST